MKTEKETIDDFHRLWYYHSDRTWRSIRWMGIPVQKTPFDLLIYQEILCEVRPDVIVECGTAFGGSALFMANICDLIGNGRVLTIDKDVSQAQPTHARIEYLSGSSVDPSVITSVQKRISSSSVVMVVLDSAHNKDHVLAEMRAYAPMVTPGSYLIVEDGNLNDHPVMKASGPGPFEAIQQFLSEQNEFEVDKSRERLMFTFNPSGYLRKKCPAKVVARESL
jgi:cephalosporin hydroxylase